MNFEFEIERQYPHSVADVWEGISTSEGISDWLMETRNFNAEAGHRFEMTCVNDSGDLDVYRCQVLEIDAPRRMVWSWALAGPEAGDPTEVEFRLTATETGTTLTLVHRGDLDRATIERFKSGWPGKLDRLAQALANRISSQ